MRPTRRGWRTRLVELVVRVSVPNPAAREPLLGDLAQEHDPASGAAPILPLWRAVLDLAVRYGCERVRVGTRAVARRTRRAALGLADDLRAAARAVRHRPGQFSLAAAILAVGLSVSAAVLTYTAGFYQPLRGVDAERLMRVFSATDADPYLPLSYPDYLDLAATESAAFEVIAADQAGFAASVRHATFTEVILGQAVTGAYFGRLGIELELGRGLAAIDDAPRAQPAVVLSRAYWRRRFAADPGIVGRTVDLNKQPYTIVGVAGRDFRGSDSTFHPDVWMPFARYKPVYWARSDRATNRERFVMQPYVRLRPEADLDQAQAEIAALGAGLDTAHPLERGPRRLHLAPPMWISPHDRVAEAPTVRLLLAAAAGLLVLVCANVANLLLSLAATRGREMAIRRALGASPARLARQLLIENMALALGAGMLALLAAGPLGARIGSYLARPGVWDLYAPRTIAVDPRVVASVIVATVATGLLAGLAPALRGARHGTAAGLRSGGEDSLGSDRRVAGRRLPGTRDILAATQVALSVVLLVVSVLVLRSLGSARNTAPGFEPDRLVASFLSTSSTDIVAADRMAFYADLAARLQSLPWVRAAAVADNAPLSPHSRVWVRLAPEQAPLSMTAVRATHGYLATIGLRVVAGRDLSLDDEAGSPGVALVNAATVRRHFGGASPLGRRIWLPPAGIGPDRPFEIVGVVDDAKTDDLLGDFEPVVYFAYPQHYCAPGNAVLLSTTIEPARALPLFEAELRAIEPGLALLSVLPYDDVIRGFTYTQRMNAELFTLVAVVGVVLAAVGIFSVLSLGVRQRRREIGLRKALGANPRAIVMFVGGRLGRTVASGLLAGLAAALAAGHVARSLLYGVEPTDTLAIATGIAVTLLAAAAAGYLPVRRAVRADPTAALSQD